jgi:host factor-I protein
VSVKGNLQDEYLKRAITNRTAMHLVLTNGKDLRGLIKGADAFTILIDIGGTELLVYKSAIAVIGPQGRATE